MTGVRHLALAHGAAPGDTEAKTDDLETLQGFHNTNTQAAPEIPQTGRRIAGIIRVDADGKNREVYATGIRNSVGMDFSTDKTRWFTDNQVDRMGDDTPLGELNHSFKAGQNFGFPWYGGSLMRTAEYKNETPQADVVPPVAELAPHAADSAWSCTTARYSPPGPRATSSPPSTVRGTEPSRWARG